MKLESFKLTIHRANDNAGAKTDTEINKSTISVLPGYTTKAVYITAPHATWAVVTPEVQDVSGYYPTIRVRKRRVFSVTTYPHTYDDGTEPDLTDIDDLVNFISAAGYYWISIEAGSRTYPTDTNKVHPVALRAWEEEPDDDNGIRNLTMLWEVKAYS